MSKKFMSWKTKGMNRDLSVTAFNPEFAFENRNLRLSTNEFNTLLSWVNEKGTAEVELYTYTPPSSSSPGGYIPTELFGIPIGTAVINHKLIVFTTDTVTDPQNQRDYIYSLTYENAPNEHTKTAMVVETLFGSENLSLGFKVTNPLETLVSYESESIQKVYWTDGINQPRVINIAGKISQTDASQFDFVPELDLQEKVTVQKMLGANGMFAPGVIQYAFTYFRRNGQESNIFYTTPLHYISYRDRGASAEDKVENAFKLTIENPDMHFDFLRIYSIQRTSINGTPIVKRVQDLSLESSEEDTKTEEMTWVNSEILPTVFANGDFIDDWVNHAPFSAKFVVEGVSNVSCRGWINNSFADIQIGTDKYNVTFGNAAVGASTIWITASPITYGGKSVYVIFETDGPSASTTQEKVNATELLPTSISYTDTGTSGDSVDPTELLYKGGESIVANTLEQKDGTLFLGNISIARDSLKEYSDVVKDTTDITAFSRQFYPTLISSGSYQYASQLTSYSDTGKSISVPCGGFKTNDVYRLGVQFQHKSGKWSEPIWVGDYVETNKPSYNMASNMVTVPTLHGQIGKGEDGQRLLKALKDAEYLKLRPVVVFPKIQDRNVLCQGVINPTVYTQEDRNNGSVEWQSSWFFRPYQDNDDDSTLISTNSMVYPPKSKTGLRYTSRQISGTEPETKTVFNPQYIRQVEIEGEYDANEKFGIDRQYRTFHSPDIEFDDQLSLIDFSSNNYYKQVGKAKFTKTMSDIDIQTESPTISNAGNGFVHKSYTSDNAKGIVSGLFYDDFIVDDSHDLEAYTREYCTAKWLVYPWQGTGSLNNDINRPADKGTATAVLKKKIISNLRYAVTEEYNNGQTATFDSNIPQLFNSDQNTIVKYNNKIYKGNIDTMLTPNYSDGKYFALQNAKNNQTPFNSTSWQKTYSKDATQPNANGLYAWEARNKAWKFWDVGAVGDDYVDLVMKKLSVRMKYKSTPHIFAGFLTSITEASNELAIVEMCQETSDETRFGGTTVDAFKENIWVPCGEPVRLDNNTEVPTTWVDPDTGEMIDVIEKRVDFDYSYGDTYFQRWDCLKTYAFTKEDINQIVEIGSFMLETHTNIDGRYDRNRGQINNLNMSPENFNLLNPVYSQIDNFFSYKIQDNSYYKDTTYPNQITWSKTKTSTADVDLWTNVTMASTLELDGDKGAISKIIRFNDQLLCFQDSGISQILYNENAQISTNQGVPIEIGNSGKVDGKRYLSTTVGCSNKWSIASTPAGIYFMDSNEKSIYLFGGSLVNLSTQGGFNTYCKYCIPSYERKWDPTFPHPVEEKFSAFTAYYDKMNQDILFINNNTALAYSEKLGAFTSFYDYAMASFFCNLDDTGIWLNGNRVWKHQAGEYCRFFGVNKPYSSILIANQEPQLSKIYTNLEFRASVDNDMWYDTVTQKYYPYLPFDSLEVWDEYQHGIGYLKDGKDVRPSSHHTLDNNANLNRKFRIWRTDVPRDNAGNEDVFDETFDRTFHIIGRLKKHPMDRMRNPWLYLRLRKEAEPENQSYADKDVEAINERIRGTVKIGDYVEDTQEVYTRETANEHNSHIEGAIMYGAQRFMNRTELQDIMMTYFD